MSKFAALAANVDTTIKVELTNPVTQEPIRDKDGRAAFIEVLSTDSQAGREFDKTRRKLSAARQLRGRNQLAAMDDNLEQMQAKLARLTRSWYLVDPATGDPVVGADGQAIPCTEENAKELYSLGPTAYIFRQVWLEADETANFIVSSSKS